MKNPLYNFYSLGPNEYFFKRENNNRTNYDEKYWGTIIDPDGVERNRLEERERHLEDICNELKYINSLKPGKILDVGCGLGYLLSGVEDTWNKFGVEISKFASQSASKYGKIFTGELEDFKEKKFDFITAIHVIEHHPKPEKLIKKIYRLIKPI